MTQRGLLRMSQYTGDAINLFDPLVKISLVLELYRIYSIVTINEVKFLFSKDLLFFRGAFELAICTGLCATKLYYEIISICIFAVLSMRFFSSGSYVLSFEMGHQNSALSLLWVRASDCTTFKKVKNKAFCLC